MTDSTAAPDDAPHTLEALATQLAQTFLTAAAELLGDDDEPADDADAALRRELSYGLSIVHHAVALKKLSDIAAGIAADWMVSAGMTVGNIAEWTNVDPATVQGLLDTDDDE